MDDVCMTLTQCGISKRGRGRDCMEEEPKVKPALFVFVSRREP